MLEINGAYANAIVYTDEIEASAEGQIRALCTKILWLHKGRQVVVTNDVKGACDSYERFLKTGGEPCL